MAEKTKDLFATALFPFRGIDRSRETFTQPPGTTPDGTNVRAFVQHRMRGGSRSGLSRYINEQVNGTQAIQHLNVIVSAHADALGWSVNGRDFGFTGIYGGIGFFGLSFGIDEFDFPEGGEGYPTQDRDRFRLTLTSDAAEVPADGTSDATLTAILRDEGNNPPPTPHTIEFRTNIDGRVGDRVQGQTDAGGQVQANVTNTRQESVLYSARDITGRVKSESVKVTYIEPGDIAFVQQKSVNESNSSDVSSVLTFDAPVSSGNTIIVLLAKTSTPTIPSTRWEPIDNLGTPYTLLNDAGVADPGNIQLSIWLGKAPSTGVCNVTMNGFAGFALGDHCFAVLEYSGMNASPFDSYVETGGTLQTAFTTTSIPVSGANRLLMGIFVGGTGGAITFTTDPGFNERCNPANDAPNNPKILVADKGNVAVAAAITATPSVASNYIGIGISFSP